MSEVTLNFLIIMTRAKQCKNQKPQWWQTVPTLHMCFTEKLSWSKSFWQEKNKNQMILYFPTATQSQSRAVILFNCQQPYYQVYNMGCFRPEWIVEHLLSHYTCEISASMSPCVLPTILHHVGPAHLQHPGLIPIISSHSIWIMPDRYIYAYTYMSIYTYNYPKVIPIYHPKVSSYL